MQTYKYHNETKEYLCSEPAFRDPMESKVQGKDVWLLPADSTFEAPMEAKEGYAVVWDDNAWEYIEDHRGQKYWMPEDSWDTQPREMKELGLLPEGAMLEAPAKPQEVIDAEVLEQAKSERAIAVASIVIEVDGMVFDGDEKAQERMARAVTLADSPEETTEWVLHDNTIAVVTAEQLRRVCKLAGKAQTALWTKPYTDSKTEIETHYTME